MEKKQGFDSWYNELTKQYQAKGYQDAPNINDARKAWADGKSVEDHLGTVPAGVLKTGTTAPAPSDQPANPGAGDAGTGDAPNQE